MYLWRIRFFLLPGLLIPGLMACGFMDLRPVALSTVPAVSGELLPEPYSPVILRFDTAMEAPDTEGLIRISSAAGQTEGDFRWEGNDLYFVPLGGWTAGTRYLLSLSGTAYARDGRELRLARYIPFFAVSSAPAPRLESFSPGDGASVGVSPEGGPVLELRFSLPMDQRSVEGALSLDSPGDKGFEWLEDDRLLRVSSPGPLSPWTSYRWTVGPRARSREGVPLVKTFSGQFITDEDRLIPRVVKVFPARAAGGSWLPRGEDLETGPGSGEGIGLEFNKPMDGDSLLRCLRFEPSLAGRVQRTGPASIVFIPERDPEPETVYTLRVSADTRDAGGLKMGADYTAYFVPDIPLLKIVSLSFTGGPVLGPEALRPEALHLGGSYPVPVDIPNGNVIRLTLAFSLPLNAEARIDTAMRVSLDAFFPGTLPPISLRFASWFSNDATLTLEWEGLDPGTGEEAHYYRLGIPGGRNGIHTGTGSFLKESGYLYLEAVKK